MLPVILRKALLPVCALSVLAGCGGGDGGGNSPPPPPLNSAPILTTTTLAATEDTPFAGQLVATDADNNVLAYTRVNDVQHGQITISATGAVAYTPAANYSGTDTFSVSVADGAGGQVTGAVTINVTGGELSTRRPSIHRCKAPTRTCRSTRTSPSSQPTPMPMR